MKNTGLEAVSASSVTPSWVMGRSQMLQSNYSLMTQTGSLKDWLINWLNDWLNNEVSNSIEESPSSETKSLSASHKITHVLWKLKVHYCVHNSPPFLLILHQVNPVHTVPSYFFISHLTIILPSMPRLPSGLVTSVTLTEYDGDTVGLWNVNT
jgi:hypothetical protein